MSEPQNLKQLRRVIYSSQTSTGKPLNTEQLDDIVIGARRFNIENGITGILWINDHIFVQVLEGTSDSLTRALIRIRKNQLHCNITINLDMSTVQRDFVDWAMIVQTPQFIDKGLPSVKTS